LHRHGLQFQWIDGGERTHVERLALH
jgi:hypothetical protein